MRILAFETSAKAASAALLSDGTLTGEFFQNSGETHSRTVMKLAENPGPKTPLSLQNRQSLQNPPNRLNRLNRLNPRNPRNPQNPPNRRRRSNRQTTRRSRWQKSRPSLSPILSRNHSPIRNHRRTNPTGRSRRRLILRRKRMAAATA